MPSSLKPRPRSRAKRVRGAKKSFGHSRTFITEGIDEQKAKNRLLGG
jgi:hypothetical protein